jgi:adenine-specific DNA-methyltransferase
VHACIRGAADGRTDRTRTVRATAYGFRVRSTAATPTAAGVRRAVRNWTRLSEPELLVDVPGASDDERSQLAVLGGLAAAWGYEAAPEWPDAVVHWAFHAPRPPQPLIELVERAFAAGLDPLAEAYNASISAANRRRLGTVFTPDDVVEHMLDLVDEQLGRPPASVIDPGAGVGAFTLAAARRWPSARVVAIDINPVTLGLLGARLAWERRQDSALRTATIELRLADYMEQLPYVFAEGEKGPAVALGNPPYTRTQALPAEYKRRASELAAGMITSGHANLAMLFQALTLAHLRPGDMSCMVLPASMVFTRAARDLRAAMWKSSRPVTVHRWPATRRAFLGREVQAAVALIGPESKRPGPIHLARVETDEDQVEVIDSWSLSRDGSPPTNWYSRREDAADEQSGVALGELLKMRRGVATGANSIFFLTDGDAASLPSKLLTPAVPTLRRFSEPVLDASTHAVWAADDNRCWLLAVDPKTEPAGALRAYLDEHVHVAERYLCRQRSVWWAITDLPRPDVLVSPLSSSGFKIVENQVGAVPSNNLLGIWTPPGTASVLADWLRSDAGQSELHRISRRYQGGSHKIEPGDLRLVRLPTAMGDLLRRGT